jgi:hypothetical protein
MENKQTRRQFLAQGSRAGVSCCLLFCSGELLAMPASDKDLPDLKKQAYEEWGMKERYNVEFDPEQIFCYGCKNEE